MATKKHESKKSHKTSQPAHQAVPDVEPASLGLDVNQDVESNGLPPEVKARTEEARFIQESPGAAQETLSSEVPPVGAVEVNMEEEAASAADRKKVHLDFYGSETLRAKAPKAFEFAEAVADDWVNDGRFEGLPVGHPLAQFAAQVSFRKAKDLEKKLEQKLEETGVLSIAKSVLENARTRLQR
ncbi:MAG: hypothetical protein KF802_03865 [Bdellovibrionaceae bacterium]|nr:hypothetical protein [Pseudobdellovibrionaceae bacterium]MBX3035192.1 hypothetical protein [Pseudobdellovibrionaceae bacterium]